MPNISRKCLFKLSSLTEQDEQTRSNQSVRLAYSDFRLVTDEISEIHCAEFTMLATTVQLIHLPRLFFFYPAFVLRRGDC